MAIEPKKLLLSEDVSVKDFIHFNIALELWNTQSLFMHRSDPVFVSFLPLAYFAELISFIKY